MVLRDMSMRSPAQADAARFQLGSEHSIDHSDRQRAKIDSGVEWRRTDHVGSSGGATRLFRLEVPGKPQARLVRSPSGMRGDSGQAKGGCAVLATIPPAKVGRQGKAPTKKKASQVSCAGEMGLDELRRVIAAVVKKPDHRAAQVTDNLQSRPA
jgi:hypothetical protein